MQNAYFFYYTLFSFTDKSHNSLLHELFVGSLNEAHISPESNYVQTLQTCALKSVRSLSAEVGHYMEEEVLKLDITWKKKKSSEKRSSGLLVLCTHKKDNVICCCCCLFVFVFVFWFVFFLNENLICVTLVFW